MEAVRPPARRGLTRRASRGQRSEEPCLLEARPQRVERRQLYGTRQAPIIRRSGR